MTTSDLMFMIIVDDMISVLINYMIYSTSPKLMDIPYTAVITYTSSRFTVKACFLKDENLS